MSRLKPGNPDSNPFHLFFLPTFISTCLLSKRKASKPKHQNIHQQSKFKKDDTTFRDAKKKNTKRNPTTFSSICLYSGRER